MSDMRDKFESDEEYENFKKSYDDFNNKRGMFDEEKQIHEYLKRTIQIQELLYKSFVLEKKKFFHMPDEVFGVKNASVYVFYFEKLVDFDETTVVMLN